MECDRALEQSLADIEKRHMADFEVLFAAYLDPPTEAYVRASDGRAVQPQVWMVFRDCVVQVHYCC